MRLKFFLFCFFYQAPNPCAVTNGGCSHFCVAKTSGHDCVCPAGLRLKSDGRTCEGSKFSDRVCSC